MATTHPLPRAVGWRWILVLTIVAVPILVVIASRPVLALDLEVKLAAALLPGYLVWLWLVARDSTATIGWSLPLLAVDAGLVFLFWQVAASALADFDLLRAYDLYWLAGTGYWEYEAAYVQPAILGVVVADASALAIPALGPGGSRPRRLAIAIHATHTALLSLACALHLTAFLVRSGATPARWFAVVVSAGVLAGTVILLNRSLGAAVVSAVTRPGRDRGTRRG